MGVATGENRIAVNYTNHTSNQRHCALEPSHQQHKWAFTSGTLVENLAKLGTFARGSEQSAYHDAWIKGLSQRAVWNDVRAFKLTAAPADLPVVVDLVFDTLLAPTIRTYAAYMAEYRRLWHNLFYSLWRSTRSVAGVRFGRRHGKASTKLTRLIGLLIDLGFVREIRGKSGPQPWQSGAASTYMRHQSVLLPFARFLELLPLSSLPKVEHGDCVEARSRRIKADRRTGREAMPARPMDFDRECAEAVQTRARLELVNSVNRKYQPTLRPKEFFGRPNTTGIRIEPDVHYTRKYTGAPQKQRGGRLYTCSDSGFQRYDKSERLTTDFGGQYGGQGCVGYDLTACHFFMPLHRDHRDYDGDPYDLLGGNPAKDDAETNSLRKARRAMTKQVYCTGINSANERETYQSCYFQSCEEVKDTNGIRRKRTGRKLKKAQKLREAMNRSGLGFKRTLQLLMEKHPYMAKYLNSGAGLELMYLDSSFALDVQYELAKLEIPCVSVHDSFIVPASEEGTLLGVMDEQYRKRFNGFEPRCEKEETDV